VFDARLAQVHVHVDETGGHNRPAALNTGTPSAVSPAPTDSILPSRIKTSAIASKPDAGSITRPR